MLKSLLRNAVAKKTKVAASITTTEGDVFYGVNVESSCPTLSICAERTALLAAITALGPDMLVEKVEVYAERHGKPIDILPCGACLQLLSEHKAFGATINGQFISKFLPNPYI